MKCVDKWLAGVTVILATTACSTTERVIDTLKTDQASAAAYRQRALDSAGTGAVSRSPLPRISGQQISLKDIQHQPDSFSGPVNYQSSGQTLEEALAILAQQIQIPIRIAESVSGVMPAGMTSTGEPSSNNRLPQSQAWVQLQWQGSLRGLLDQLAQISRLYWRYQDGQIEFFLYETRHFNVFLPIGNRSVSASISGSGTNGQSSGNASGGNSSGLSGASGTGAISVNTGAIEVNPYATITSAISAILLDESPTEVVATERSGSSSSGTSSNSSSGSGSAGAGSRVNTTHVGANSGETSRAANQGRSRVVVSPELGMITVTAPPPSLERVAQYVEGVNRRFARNVLIDLKIYDIALNDTEGAGFSADLLFRRLNQFGLELVSAPSVGFGNTTPGQATLSVTNPNSRFNGSQLVAEALSSFGNVSVTTSGQVMAINGQPAPLQIAEEVNYLASSSTSITPGTINSAIQTTSLTPGSRVVGLTANFLPLILPDNRILLQYQLTMSSLLAMDVVTSGNTSIQTPRIASQSVQQQAFVRDGQTLVLFGFEQNSSSLNGNVSLLGASRAATGKRNLRVIVMQIFGGSRDA